jgi:putative transposase
MIDRKHEHLSIRRQCAALGIWRSNVYYCAEVRSDESILANEIHEIWLDMPQYGYRKITAELQKRSHKVNRKRVLRMMRDMCIQALYPKPKTTKINSEHKKYPYLLRDLKITGPNHVWATDITYIRLPSGFVYLVVIIDIYSRFIVSWSLSTTLETDFCLESLNAALKNGKKPKILNTDQGVQFTSIMWIQTVEGNGIKVSMDGIRRWVDNVFVERFWRTVKHEHILLHAFETIKEARKSIGQFIDVYNHKRLHQSLGYRTPAEVYFDMTKQA